MLIFDRYGPIFCIGGVLLILFLIWLFWVGSENNDQTTSQEIIQDNQPDFVPEEIQNSIEPEVPEVCMTEPDVEPVIQPPSIPKVCFPPLEGKLNPRNNTKISRGERICRQTMEKIYGLPFITVRPDWLRNPETGENMELDCYNNELRIAVEYNGEQHYNWPNHTSQTETEFINQIRRDELKRKICDDLGVYLIVVPYNIAMDKIPDYIKSYIPEFIRRQIDESQLLSGITTN